MKLTVTCQCGRVSPVSLQRIHGRALIALGQKGNKRLACRCGRTIPGCKDFRVRGL